MKISEIARGAGNVSLQAKVVDKGEKREVNTKYGRRSVADVTLEDETGQISLSLWEEKIDAVKIGDRVSLDGGYVTEFRDRLQLNLPRNGKLEVVSE
jgi:replication factor A1